MADISFTLLIFFLVTTSMDTDRGLVTRLPEPPDPNMNEEDVKIRKRNMMVINVNLNNQIMCRDQIVTVGQIKDLAKDFIANPTDDPEKPDKWPVELPAPFGTQMITKNHVISLQTDRAASYEVYFNIYNELKKAYNELRDELAKKTFGKGYAQCNEDQQTALRAYYPFKVSEAEARKYGGAK